MVSPLKGNFRVVEAVTEYLHRQFCWKAHKGGRRGSSGGVLPSTILNWLDLDGRPSTKFADSPLAKDFLVWLQQQDAAVTPYLEY